MTKRDAVYMIREMKDIEIIHADPTLSKHATAIVELLDEYASDPMGGGEGLSDFTKRNLSAQLAKRDTAHVILAYENGEAIGMIISFEGFSTFQCKPLLNIHDVIVRSSHRGKGIAKHLLAATEELAKTLGCCKLTLEILEGNLFAQKAYAAYGFKNYQLDPALGNAMFWEKYITQI